MRQVVYSHKSNSSSTTCQTMNEWATSHRPKSSTACHTTERATPPPPTHPHTPLPNHPLPAPIRLPTTKLKRVIYSNLMHLVCTRGQEVSALRPFIIHDRTVSALRPFIIHDRTVSAKRSFITENQTVSALTPFTVQDRTES